MAVDCGCHLPRLSQAKLLQVHTCDLQRELDGGSETPHSVEASAKAAAAWKVLVGRLAKHNITANFLHDILPPMPSSSTQADAVGDGAAGTGARGRWSGTSLGYMSSLGYLSPRDKVVNSLNAALAKLKKDERQQHVLEQHVKAAHSSLKSLHLQLGNTLHLQLAPLCACVCVPASACGRGRWCWTCVW